MKKVFSFVLIFLLLALLGLSSFLLKRETGETVGVAEADIVFFFMPGCPHCAEEEEFLDGLVQEHPQLKIARFNVFKKQGVDLLQELYQTYQVPEARWGRVPVTFTKQHYFVGFNDQVKKDLTVCLEDCLAIKTSQDASTQASSIVQLPLLGKIDLAQYSLPSLAVILGFFDGFNVCSLGALVLILSLVLSFQSRKKILIFGAVFIAATAFVYGFLILLWHQMFSLLLPQIELMQVLIGLLGVAGSVYFLKEFWRFKQAGPNCKIEAGGGLVAKFSNKIRNVFQDKGSILALVIAVLLFAAVITIVEFPCSAAVPGVFAGILADAHLPAWQYLSLISLFILFYMLDEMIVFAVALLTRKIRLASQKFVVWITLVESIVLFLLGFYYLFG